MNKSLTTLKTGAIKEIDNEWYTPFNVYKNILKMFNLKHFNYDPATTKEIAEKVDIKYFDDIDTDGLKQDWRSYHNIYINPPFSLKKEFIEKSYHQITDPKSLIKNIFIVLPIETLTNLNVYDILEKDFLDQDQKIKRNLIIPKGRIKFNKIENGIFIEKTSPFFSSIILHFSTTEKYNIKWIDINKED